MPRLLQFNSTNTTLNRGNTNLNKEGDPFSDTGDNPYLGRRCLGAAHLVQILAPPPHWVCEDEEAECKIEILLERVTQLYLLDLFYLRALYTYYIGCS
jgi:hypothetical protein